MPGKDKEYAARLKTLFDAMKLENVTVLDYVDDMAALMHGCDLAILKSGGLTVTECLCAHLPMILLGKSYGQERPTPPCSPAWAPACMSPPHESSS